MKYLVIALFTLAASTTAFGQASGKTKEALISELETQIAAENKRAVTGLLVGVGGLGLTALSIAFIPSEEYKGYDEGWEQTGNSGLFWTCLVGGGVMTAVGGIMINIAASRGKEYQRKLHDLKYSFRPLYIPGQNNALGLALVGKF